MRMSRERLAEVTGLKYGKAQARWFQDYLAATVPCDRIGPIITEQTFEELVARASGIRRTGTDTSTRPAVRLRAA